LVAVIVVIALAALGGYLGWHWWRSTPEYAMSQIKKSLQEKDIMRFRETEHLRLSSLIDVIVLPPLMNQDYWRRLLW
jgi:hypothetical protein